MDVFTLTGQITIDIQNALTNIESVIKKVQELEDSLNGTDDSTQETGEIVEEATTSATTKTGSALNKWSVMMGNLATQVANKVYNAGKSFFQTGFEYNQNMEKWTATFKTYMGGDIDAATAFMEEVRQFAVETPLSLSDSAQSAIRLMASGIGSSEVIDTLSMLGDIANGDTEKMSRLALVYSQVMAAGKLGGNDPIQFKEAGVPIYDLLAQYYDAMGISYGDLTEMQKAGDIKSQHVLGALIMATQEGGMYFNAMNNIMDTEYGQAQKMKDNYEQMAGALTNAIFEVFTSDTIPALNEVLQQLNEWATENPDVLEHLAEAISNLATNGIEILVGGLQKLLDFWDDNQEAFDTILIALGALAVTNGNVKTGAALLAAGGIDLYSDVQEDIAETEVSPDTPTGLMLTSNPAVAEAAQTGETDDLNLWEGYNYHVAVPFWKYLENMWEWFSTDPKDEWTSIAPEGALDTNPWSSEDDGFNVPEGFNLLPHGIEGVGGNNGTGTWAEIAQQLSTLKSDIMAATQEGVEAGLGNVTINAYVTAGDVKLDGKTVGEMTTPHVDVQLGTLEYLRNRG